MKEIICVCVNVWMCWWEALALVTHWHRSFAGCVIFALKSLQHNGTHKHTHAQGLFPLDKVIRTQKRRASGQWGFHCSGKHGRMHMHPYAVFAHMHIYEIFGQTLLFELLTCPCLRAQTQMRTERAV